jgi:aarF domain-containing kinase
MTWETGTPMGQWLREPDPKPSDRLWVAQALLELYCREFFEWGLVQTDPNFGNFLVREAERRIVLLDFGATLEFERDFRQRYVRLLRAAAAGDDRRVVEDAVTFGLLDARESPETQGLFVTFLATAVEPFEGSKQPFAFRDAGYAERSAEISRRFLRSLAFSPPPKRLLFLHRKLGGIFQLLKKLDVELDLRPYWKRMIDDDRLTT